MNEKRARALGAIWRAAAKRGWRREVIGHALASGRTVHLGKTTREVSFDVGDALTSLLQQAPVEVALRKALAGDPTFAEEAVTALKASAPGAPGTIQLADVELRPHEVPGAVALPELDPATVAELDAFAATAIGDYLRHDRTIWAYRDKETFDADMDDWATIADWVDVAERAIDRGRAEAAAIVILLDAGDSRGDTLARAYLLAAQPHHEVSADEVTIVWRYRHAFPEVACQWFVGDGSENVPFAASRAALGDPVAKRYEELGGADDAPDEAALHSELLEWARHGHRWSPPDASQLREAAARGWNDVAEALASNPFLPVGLLTTTRREDQFDEPGMLMAREFLLVWSHFAPSRFLAQLIAAAQRTDLPALAERAAREAVARNPQAAGGLEMSIGAYGTWWNELQPALAIAWRRCRRFLVQSS